MAEANEIDLAEGQAASENAPVYRRSGEGQPAVEASSLLAPEGLVAAEHKTEEGFVDPGVVQVLYHKYDGRQVVVPQYMAPKLLATRIQDVTGVPRQYAGLLAWSTAPNSNFTPGTLKCILHADQLPEVLAELESVGLSPGRCTKDNITSLYNATKHAELKHKAEWAALLDKREKTEHATDRETAQIQAEATLKVAEALLAQATPAKAKKVAE